MREHRSRVPPGAVRPSVTQLGGLEPGPAAVLVEPVAEVGARVPGGPVTLELADRRLGPQRLERVQRVAELAGQDHPVVADGVARVDRGEVLGGTRQGLEAVHVVGHGHGPAGRVAGRLVHVPRRPGIVPAGHDALVRVEHHLVAVVLEAAQGRPLRVVRVAQGRQGVVRVGRHDQGVEPLGGCRPWCGWSRRPRRGSRPRRARPPASTPPAAARAAGPRRRATHRSRCATGGPCPGR